MQILVTKIPLKSRHSFGFKSKGHSDVEVVGTHNICLLPTAVIQSVTLMILWYITIYIILEYMSELLKKQTKSY